LEIRIDWNILLDRIRRAHHKVDINIIDYANNLKQELSISNPTQISDPRLSTYCWDLGEIVQYCSQPLPNHIIAQLSFLEENAIVEFGGVSTFNLFYHTQGLKASLLNVKVHLPDPGYLRYKSESLIKCILNVLKKPESGHHEAGIYEIKLHPGGEVENIHSIQNGRQPIITFNKPSRGSKFPYIGFSFKKSIQGFLWGIIGGIIGETVAILIYYKLFK
jgi:hypothetical protein